MSHQCADAECGQDHAKDAPTFAELNEALQNAKDEAKDEQNKTGKILTLEDKRDLLKKWLKHRREMRMGSYAKDYQIAKMDLKKQAEDDAKQKAEEDAIEKEEKELAKKRAKRLRRKANLAKKAASAVEKVD